MGVDFDYSHLMGLPCFDWRRKSCLSEAQLIRLQTSYRLIFCDFATTSYRSNQPCYIDNEEPHRTRQLQWILVPPEISKHTRLNLSQISRDCNRARGRGAIGRQAGLRLNEITLVVMRARRIHDDNNRETDSILSTPTVIQMGNFVRMRADLIANQLCPVPVG